MKVKYNYASPSMCTKNNDETTLGLSPDLSRDEKVSFLGRLKNPLIFRDAMLMLREIVISDNRVKEKNRDDFFNWLEDEIERRVNEELKKMPNVREEITKKMNNLSIELENKQLEILEVLKVKSKLQEYVDKTDIWKDYNELERKFWKFIRDKDSDLWFVLDPVITVHKDKVSFEAFSLDESIYGCLSIDMEEFELLQEPKLGTTNIDFSYKLAKEIERFRTYNDVTLSVNPEGFSVESGIIPEYVEKKIDLPETWIKGFNQVSAAASMPGIDLKITKTDMYDICAYLRKHKEKESPRYMKFILEPEKNIKILFEPFKDVITLESIYKGDKKREEKVWGRRRWLVMEKLLPLANNFTIKLLGFGMPQFIVCDMGGIKMTIGFTSWSSNDWVKGTSFNIMAGFIGNGAYKDVYNLLKTERALTLDEIKNSLKHIDMKACNSGIGMLFKKGEAYYDIVSNKVRFRQLVNEPIPEELYEITKIEKNVLQYLKDKSMDNFELCVNENGDYVFKDKMTYTEYYSSYKYLSNTEVVIDKDGTICNVDCNCSTFRYGSKNISQPCEHILALYINCIKYLNKANFEVGKVYKINDIVEQILL